MRTIEQNLERSFHLFVDRPEQLSFFKGLADYIGYVLVTPELKKCVDAQKEERKARYTEVNELEKKVLTEVEGAKKKLLHSLEKTHLDASTFRRYMPHSSFPDPLTELRAYESEELRKSGWRSDNLLHYLFEIAANMRIAGFTNDVGEFLVSPEEYQAYHMRADSSAAHYVVGNEHGNFIFSQTWPERVRAEAIIETERKLKPWGAFETILQFKSAYDKVCKNGNFNTIMSESEGDDMALKDAVEAAYMADDLRTLIGKGSLLNGSSGNSANLRYLDHRDLRISAQTVHECIMRGLAVEPGTENSTMHKATSEIKIDADSLVYGTIKVPMERGQRAMIQLFLKNANIIRNGRLFRNGEALSIHTYMEAGGYRNEDSFRDALKLLKGKLKSGSFPAKIRNVQTGKYQMFIDYTTTHYE